MEEKILFDEQKPTKDGKYHTNRGHLEFSIELNHFLDDSGFPIYSDDKIKWWVDKSNVFIFATEKRIGWIKKRVELSELQEEYVRFILNDLEQENTRLINQVKSLKEINVDEEDFLSKEIPESEWGVHRTHCCSKHGCKYGYTNCPVEKGLIEQEYPCEVCSEEKREKEYWDKKNGKSLDN